MDASDHVYAQSVVLPMHFLFFIQHVDIIQSGPFSLKSLRRSRSTPENPSVSRTKVARLGPSLRKQLSSTSQSPPLSIAHMLGLRRKKPNALTSEHTVDLWRVI